ncbi:hypothetical protein LUZ63_012233 [Rhynchospora breviuscula]|uniref:F-box domain-containing protein n=1 Tax=Rhynchospora breviuscula TaxID=2022672 RepID=A0A9Q0HRS4_9POAL|nr:hypothetical protein LUZ63_012233 [Rhynchospora breviuscula]
MWEEKDWSNLPAELLHLISQKLPKLSDYVRFRVVCKIWRFSAPLSDHPPQLPGLIKHEASYYPAGVIGHEMQFYSIFSGETGILCKNLPSTHRGKIFTGPSLGCLLLTDAYSNCVLFNPLTNKDMTSLPSLRSRPKIVWPWPVWTVTSPIPNRDIILVYRKINRNNAKGSWFFYDRDNGKWIASESGYNFYSFCYSGGKLFLIKGDYFTEVFDVSSRKILSRIAPLRNEQPPFRLPSRIYLVESAGEILRVSLDYETFVQRKIVFSIHKLAKLDVRNGDCHVYSWVKVSSISDQMLFLDYYDGFSMSCRPFAGHKGNCIYFFDSSFLPCSYNIEDGSVEQVLPYSPLSLFTWFVPDLR